MENFIKSSSNNLTIVSRNFQKTRHLFQTPTWHLFKQPVFTLPIYHPAFGPSIPWTSPRWLHFVCFLLLPNVFVSLNPSFLLPYLHWFELLLVYSIYFFSHQRLYNSQNSDNDPPIIIVLMLIPMFSSWSEHINYSRKDLYYRKPQDHFVGLTKRDLPHSLTLISRSLSNLDPMYKYLICNVHY